MLAAALIVFREVLEAALVVSIVMAATRGLPHRNKWVSLGILGGIAGAGAVAALANAISSAFEGTGQEIVNAGILFVAVLLIGWHVVWMNSHGRKMTMEMRAVGKSVAEGEKHMSILAIVVGLAVMREGSEIVLMLQGLWAAGSSLAMFGGGALGLAAGMLTGALLYAGLLALPVQRVFSLTNGILVLIAAGMAARGANFLAQAGLLPPLGTRLWDTSFILSDQSLAGQALGALIGYIAQPSGIELMFYGVTVLAICALMFGARGRALAFGAVILAGTCLMLPHAAKAEEVFSPYVVKGELELEHQGVFTHDRDPENSGEQEYEFAVGYSPTSFWRTELEGEFEREAGPDEEALHYESFNWLNIVALAEPGEYWIDPAAFFELGFARDSEPNEATFGLIGAKQIGRTLHTVNLFGHKEFGPGADPNAGFAYSEQSKYRLFPWLEPGFEIFGDADGQSRFQDQQLGVGPGLFGKIYTFNGQALKYEASYLFGVTRATPDGMVRWKLEYEFFF